MPRQKKINASLPLRNILLSGGHNNIKLIAVYTTLVIRSYVLQATFEL